MTERGDSFHRKAGSGQPAPASPADPGAAEPISLPGEPERRIAARRGRDGIPLPARTHEQLAAVAAGVGVGPPR